MPSPARRVAAQSPPERTDRTRSAAGKLQKPGVIDYHRGHITVLDRPKLEQLSCECYAVVKTETDCLLPHLHA
jgi:hypothetical protein